MWEGAPETEETSEIRGQVSNIQGMIAPGTEETSGIRGQIPGAQRR